MQKKILYPLATLFVAWFFGWGIPVDVFESYSGILSVIGSILFAGGVTLSAFQFVPKREPAKTIDEERARAKADESSSEGCVIVIMILVSLFGFGAFLIFHGISRTETELKEHGVYTIGTITDGSSYEGRRSSETVVTIHFENKKGEKRVANVEISPSQFDKFYKNQQIPIVYSEQYQTLVKVLDSNDAVNQYTNQKVRDVNLNDLEHIFELKSQKQITEYLNGVNPEWKYRYSRQDSTEMYLNEMKQMGLKVSENEVDYILPPDTPLNEFRAAAIESGYEKIEGDKKDIEAQFTQQQMYIKDGYMLLIRYKHIQPERNSLDFNNRDVKIEMPKTFGVVTLIKQ